MMRSWTAAFNYDSASDVLKDALHLLEEQDRYTALHTDEIRAKIAKEYESLRAGKRVDGETAFERIEKELVAFERDTSRSPA